MGIISRRESDNKPEVEHARPSEEYTLVTAGYRRGFLSRLFGKKYHESILIGEEPDLVRLSYLGKGKIESRRNGSDPIEQNIVEWDPKFNGDVTKLDSYGDWSLLFGISGKVHVRRLYRDRAVVVYEAVPWLIEKMLQDNPR